MGNKKGRVVYAKITHFLCGGFAVKHFNGSPFGFFVVLKTDNHALVWRRHGT